MQAEGRIEEQSEWPHLIIFHLFLKTREIPFWSTKCLYLCMNALYITLCKPIFKISFKKSEWKHFLWIHKLQLWTWLELVQMRTDRSLMNKILIRRFCSKLTFEKIWQALWAAILDSSWKKVKIGYTAFTFRIKKTAIQQISNQSENDLD